MPITDARSLEGATVYGSAGDKLGKVDGIYEDSQTGKPEWAAVKTGLFGGHVSLVPLSAANRSAEGLTVPFDKEMVKNAPHHDPDAELSADAERELFTHYGIPYGGDTVTATGGPGQGAGQEAQAGRRDLGGQAGVQGRDTSRPTTGEAMTRSEEQLNVGTQQVEAGRARLRKQVVTEQVTQAVPVSHEEVTVEREPITEANREAAMSGRELTEEEHEVVLHAEQPVVTKETVPVERVRLGTETVTGEEQVSDQVRKEQIEQVTNGEGRQA